MCDEQPIQRQPISPPVLVDAGQRLPRVGVRVHTVDPYEEGIRALAEANGDRHATRPRWNRRPAGRAGPRCTTYPASAESVAAARSDVVRMARDAGASNAALADIGLAVSEASTNAVMHAYALSGARGETFTIAVASAGAQFSVWVTDEGQGGEPSAPSPGLGLGLEIMTRLSERLVIGALDDGRTQVEMRFDLD